jgi:hypothetical protein
MKIVDTALAVLEEGRMFSRQGIARVIEEDLPSGLPQGSFFSLFFMMNNR